jgi:pilus assembly protein Flp/PilA
MLNLLRNLWKDESGQDVAEYALMLAVILVVVSGAIIIIGNNANAIFGTVGTTLGAAPGA